MTSSLPKKTKKRAQNMSNIFENGIMKGSSTVLQTLNSPKEKLEPISSPHERSYSP
jgi:hypothetical protein